MNNVNTHTHTYTDLESWDFPPEHNRWTVKTIRNAVSVDHACTQKQKGNERQSG